MLLSIVQAGHPVLRQRARPLGPAEIASPEIQKLIADMRETMHAAPGVGLAAPQVGLAIQLAVIEDTAERMAKSTAGELSQRERTGTPFQVIINPRLTLEGGPPLRFYEGCLSVPPWVAVVPRAPSVRVEALDENGRPVTIRAHGWHARILQHEIDHLRGVLCIDRMDPLTFTTPENYEAFVRTATTST